MSKIICGIYKIENTTNGKIYIGQSKNIYRRWKDHKKEYKWKNSKYANYPLYKAINKYGINNFTFSILEECEPNELNEKEIYWIHHFDSVNNGYNISNGGFEQTKKTFDKNDILNIVNLLKNTNLTQADIAKKYNTTQENISQINTGKYYTLPNINYPIRKKICGIYKIENTINGKVYIGQSKNIQRRWKDHQNINNNNYNSHIDNAIKKYKKENFIFSVLEECKPEELNEKEIYWINFFNSLNKGYNKTSGGNQPEKAYHKLNEKSIKEIEFFLKETNISMEQIAKQFNVTKGLIARINEGDIHNTTTQTEQYPIRKHNILKKSNHCKKCKKQISNKRHYCNECYKKIKKQRNKEITKEELEQLIQTTSFVQIGKIYGISDNAIRKWCKKYNLPYKQKNIKEKYKKKT